MTSILLALCALLVMVGATRLCAALLDYRASLELSAHRAAELVAWAQAEFPPHSRVRHACMAAMTQPVAEVSGAG